MVINEDDIKYAESVLLPEGETFDDERKLFIRCLETKDLQACPGSGKTTCLLAKLLILEKHLPFADGSGILVLSHTNAAIDEIKEQLGIHCPKLFSYPNFVGTIQSFVDHFLAIPYYCHRFKKKPYRIDDEIFFEKIYVPRDAQVWLSKVRDKDQFLRDLRFDEDNNLIRGIGKKVEAFPIKDKDTPTYKALLSMRENLMQDGYLCFDDTYFLASKYLQSFSKIISLFQRRFSLVFIDEMQDTDTHQLKILNQLFESPNVILQRIGDQNQAIYSSSVRAENIWDPSDKYLIINGSKRLSLVIANTIKNICINPQDLQGNTKHQDIKPIIIFFDDKTIDKVLPTFGNLIIEHDLHKDNKYPSKAVGWVKEGKKVNSEPQLGISSYFENYQKKVQTKFQDYPYLCDYLLYCDKKNIEKYGFHIIRKQLLNAIIKALRIAEVSQADEDKPYSVPSFLKWFRDYHEEKYEKLKANLYFWSMSTYKGEDVYEVVKIYITEELLKNIFQINEQSDKLKEFLKQHSTNDKQITTKMISSNMYEHEYTGSNKKCQGIRINIEVSTIHGVKGETHAATLYLETYYFRDGRKSYESQRLIEALKGNKISNPKKRVAESLKMAYVGMSRPAKLLCFGVHTNHIVSADRRALESLWDILDLSEKVSDLS